MAKLTCNCGHSFLSKIDPGKKRVKCSKCGGYITGEAKQQQETNAGVILNKVLETEKGLFVWKNINFNPRALAIAQAYIEQGIFQSVDDVVNYAIVREADIRGITTI